MNDLRTRLRGVLSSIDALDVVLVIGLGLLCYGLSQFHPALPFIAVGGLFVAAWAGVGQS